MAMQRQENDLDQLNSFLRGEIAAVKTYDQALERLDGEVGMSDTLLRCRSSHAERVKLLSEEIRRLGGDPADDAGPWGSFAQLVTGGAKMFGKKAAIAALEEGEDHGRDDYQRDLQELSPALKRLVQSQLLPEQLRTHDALSKLKHQM